MIVDKNGIEICVGDIVQYGKNVQLYRVRSIDMLYSQIKVRPEPPLPNNHHRNFLGYYFSSYECSEGMEIVDSSDPRWVLRRMPI